MSGLVRRFYCTSGPRFLYRGPPSTLPLEDFRMKLYYSPGACSQNPHIMLREAGLKFDLVKVNLGTHKTEKGADYYGINPKGYVPALELDNGQVLTENIAIVQYIADQKPEAKLSPAAGSFERYRLQEWLAFIRTEVHKTLAGLWDPN